MPFEAGNPMPVTVTTGSALNTPAQPVYVVSGGAPVAGRARRVVVVSGGPMKSGPAIPVMNVGAGALYTDDPPIPVVVIQGTLVAAVPASDVYTDAFTTAAAAGAVDGTAAESGPGNRSVTDSAGTKLSISGGRLQIATPPTSGFSDPRYNSPSTFQRRPGRVLSFTARGNNVWAGLGGAADNGRHGVYFNTTNINFIDDGSGVANGLTINITTDYTITVIERLPAGALVYIQGGAYTTPTLLGVSNSNSAAMRIFLACGGNTGALQYDDVRLRDYGGATAQRFGLASAAHYAPATGQTFTIAADSWIEFNWLPNTGETLNIIFRRSDASNYWTVRCSNGGSTTKIIEVNAGVETERASVATTWNAAQFRVVVELRGTSIRVYRNKALLTSYGSATFNQTATGAEITGFLNDDINSALCEYAAWTIAPAGTFPPDGTLPKFLLPYGDSKTNGSGDTIPPGLSSNGYPPILCASLEAATSYGWHEAPARVGRGGFSVATGASTFQSTVDADITARATSIAPDYILVNMGVNDTGTPPSQSNFVNGYLYVLDALHTAWPNARIGCMRIWSRNEDADSATINGYINLAIAARSFAFAGPDESVFLKNGADNGTTYTADGIHPNRAGYILTAAQWRTAMGI